MTQVITALSGGLGNQMFQYAAGRSLSLRLDADLLVDLESFRTDNPRSYSLDIFELPVREASVAEVSDVKARMIGGVWGRLYRKFLRHRAPVVSEPYFHYWSGFEKIDRSVYLSGFWQSSQYFARCADRIRSDFRFPPFDTDARKSLARDILSAPCATSVHIRRGDYVASQATYRFHGVCGQEYYQDALMYLRRMFPEMTLYIFSDDLVWVAQNIDLGGLKAVYVDGNRGADSFRDMQLMALCRNHIIANSSFSWWGAWLGPGGVTVAPRQWFGELGHRDTQDICPREWVLM